MQISLKCTQILRLFLVVPPPSPQYETLPHNFSHVPLKRTPHKLASQPIEFTTQKLPLAAIAAYNPAHNFHTNSNIPNWLTLS